MTPDAVQALRDDTPGCQERIHLNNAGAGLMPRSVVEAAVAHLNLELRIGGYEAANERVDSITSAYDAVADLVGCHPHNVAFAPSATHAYAQALSSIPFEPEDVVLTTTNDDASNQIMFMSLQRRCGVRIEFMSDTEAGEIDVDQLQERLARPPRVVAVTHVPTNSGLVQPIAAIGEACADVDTTYLVDACQSVGHMPVDVGKVRCDFLSATSRKYLRGPRGAGFLIVADRVLARGDAPLLPDMRGAEWSTPNSMSLSDTANRFEYWEQSYALLLATGEAARYTAKIGLATIERRINQLAGLTRERLQSAGLAVLDRGSTRCGIVTVSLPGCDPSTTLETLRRRGINVSLSVREAATLDFDRKGVSWALRISPHCYNTEDEIEEGVQRVLELAGRQ